MLQEGLRPSYSFLLCHFLVVKSLYTTYAHICSMTDRIAGSIFPRSGAQKGKTIMYSAEEIKQGQVDGPWVIEYAKGRYPIVDALVDPLAAIGLKEGKKSGKKEISPVPKPGTGYSGRLNHRDSERIGEVAYKMIRDEIEA